METVARKLQKRKIQSDSIRANKEKKKPIFLSFSERAGFAKDTES
jgi:hypothetical protein